MLKPFISELRNLMLLLGNCNDHLKEIKDNSIDLLLTDPPYALTSKSYGEGNHKGGFMGKEWDKALVSVETWRECYRVLKNGKLAFIMSSPRQDVLSRMIVNLQDAGFRTNYTSIYWTFASGFPKAANVSKLIDKRGGANLSGFAQIIKQERTKRGWSTNDLGAYFPSKTGGLTGCVRNWEAGKNLPTIEEYNKLIEILELDREQLREVEREIIGKGVCGNPAAWYGGNESKKLEYDITKPATEAAKAMEGAYVGFQPKPAVEVILVVSKGKTLTWLDSVRIPYQSEDDKTAGWHKEDYGFGYREWSQRMGYDKVKKELERGEPPNEKGRFPANLIVSDDILNDGSVHKSGKFTSDHKARNIRSVYGDYKGDIEYSYTGDSGSYSRYFSLDQWWAKTFPFLIVPKPAKSEKGEFNSHPTVKSQKLMSYLITMGSREGDLVLDPFCGSGTTLLAAHQLHRKYLGIELNPEYAQIIKKRMLEIQAQLKLTIY